MEGAGMPSPSKLAVFAVILYFYKLQKWNNKQPENTLARSDFWE